MRLDDLAGQLDATGDELAGASTTMALADPGSRVLGADTPGGLGELGRALHRRLTVALTARGREASEHGARFADAALTVRQIADGYRTVEHEIKARHDDGAS